jgi:hypothetical protein
VTIPIFLQIFPGKSHLVRLLGVFDLLVAEDVPGCWFLEKDRNVKKKLPTFIVTW